MTKDDAIDFEVYSPTTLSFRPTLRLTKLVKSMNFYDIPKGMCTWCGENEATCNLNTSCRRCFFYKKNQFNDRMYKEGICMTCDQLHITDGRLYCIKCKPDEENKK